MAKWFNKLFNHKQGPTHNPNHPRYLEFHPELRPQPQPTPTHQNCERKIQDLRSEIARVTQER